MYTYRERQIYMRVLWSVLAQVPDPTKVRLPAGRHHWGSAHQGAPGIPMRDTWECQNEL